MRIPSSTYRLQLSPQFGFRNAAEMIPYLADLGISDLYVSPIFRACKGSTHGYDVTDPTQLNPELGTREDVEELFRMAHGRGMGWLQDIVPNHMAFDSENVMLMDVLENGVASPYATFFDIEWNHPSEDLKEKVLAPFLGKFYGECLEQGEIQLRYDDRGMSIHYYDLRLPLRFESYATVLTVQLDRLKDELGTDHPDMLKFQGVLFALRNLPPPTADNERREQTTFAKKMLWELYSGNEHVKKFIDDNLSTFNGEPGKPESFNLLDELLSAQLYRLSFWKVATEEINYRRFFNINQLISLRMEDEQVFQATHALILDMVNAGHISGLRIDHVDGLLNPEQYLTRLREQLPEAYVVVEKILHPDEELPRQWPVEGTTGYDYLNYVNGVFCERKNDKRFDKIYSKFTGRMVSFDVLVANTKRLIMGRHMAGDIDRLAHVLKNISTHDRHARDITLYGLRRALVEILTFFPVYRSYVNDASYSEKDRSYILEAVRKAKESSPALVLEIDFIERFLLLQFHDYISEEEKQKWVHFVMRFQQLTGPLMAKGFEDTALYVYNKLLSLNDVGGSPNRFGDSLLEFHHFNKKRASGGFHALNTTATHDTKRGEDVRARINVLSELPDEWNRRISVWTRINQRHKTVTAKRDIPDKNDEFFYYQSLIGAFPIQEAEYPEFVERMVNYMMKAVREAKVHTAWLKPDEEYEKEFTDFIRSSLAQSEENHFLQDFLPFQKKIGFYGVLNSLSQVLLKMTCPGVPDFYQGTELWDLSLVDPDNRRPVNFRLRKKYLDEMKALDEGQILSYAKSLQTRVDDGRIKMFVIWRTLRARKSRPYLFTHGSYVPLKVRGRHRNHVIAFARIHNQEWGVIVAPRRIVGLTSPDQWPLAEAIWEDTTIRLPDGAPNLWQHAFTGTDFFTQGEIRLFDICREFSLGLLTSSSN